MGPYSRYAVASRKSTADPCYYFLVTYNGCVVLDPGGAFEEGTPDRSIRLSRSLRRTICCTVFMINMYIACALEILYRFPAVLLLEIVCGLTGYPNDAAGVVVSNQTRRIRYRIGHRTRRLYTLMQQLRNSLG